MDNTSHPSPNLPLARGTTQRTQTITLLGATGSIGLSTLDVVRRHRDRFSMFALTAQRRRSELLTLCVEFLPKYAVIDSAIDAAWLTQQCQQHGLSTEILHGADALCHVAAHPDVHTVMAAIVGAAGLAPTFAAASAGKRVLLANKEALVMAGGIFMDAVRASGATLLPVDSEHNAIFQCLPQGLLAQQHASTQKLAAQQSRQQGIQRLILTASGGPFRHTALADLQHVTPQQACAHPNWSMGQKISVDSATMMNKGLEVIEAHWLFGLPAQQIDVVLHPESVVHSMVEYCDGSVLAQLGQPDMRTPIANALAYPERIDAGVARLNFPQLAALTFAAPDDARFPCLPLAYDALDRGQSASVILNAANEICVTAFLEGQIKFPRIANTLAHMLHETPMQAMHSLTDVLRINAEARQATLQYLGLTQSRVQ